MIRTIVIMTTSGLLLYSKEFSNSIAQPSMVGSLLTAMIEFSQQTTGMAVSFINLSSFSIAIVINETAKIFCALFYDKDDGKLFGKLICSEILNAFIQDYSSDFTRLGRNLNDYKGFQKKMENIIYYSVRPVISLLESKPGITKALIVRDKEIIDSQKEEINEFAILANIPSLIEMADEISKSSYFYICTNPTDSLCKLHYSIIWQRLLAECHY
jgi:hypothetical protein